MAELVAGAFLSSFLQAAFERLTSPDLFNYFCSRKLDEDLLTKLHVILISMNKIVEEAEERQYRDHSVKQWLDKLKDEVFKAQDFLDDIAIEALRRKLHAKSQTAITAKVRGFFTTFVNHNSLDKEIESGIKQALNNLEYLIKQNDILGLREGPSAGIRLGENKKVYRRLPTTILIDESNVYGRDADKEKIVEILLSQNKGGNQLPMDVISITGMGGVGKTTLARSVYEDLRMEDHFQRRAWVCVSEEFDVDRVTKAILESLNCLTDKLHDFHSHQLKLREILMGKKFLLVLDDVWNENCKIWEVFQAPLKPVASQSKILITTRNRRVAEVMCCTFTHSLKPLEDGECWNLFAKHAFDSEHRGVDADLVEIGREIVNKCGGLPLAIKTLASLLHRKLSLDYWDKILQSDIWQLSENDNYDIDKNDLIQLWMADGLIYSTKKSMILEEVGNDMFNDLESRSFFEPSRKGGDYFIMHDLVNDLAKSVAGDFCVQLDVVQAQDISINTRYFSYINKTASLETFEKVFKCHRLRSFLQLDAQFPYNFHIDGDIMSKLSRLNYIREFSLRGSTDFKYLTDSISNLRHLHYLDISETSVKKLPNSMCLLINLQTLKLRSCCCLTKLPSKFHKLVNLRHLDLEGCGIEKMPKYMGKLIQLRTMNKLIVGKDGGSSFKDLGALKHLTGSLTISNMDRINDATYLRMANLKEKQLNSLKLQYNEYCYKEAQHQEHILEALELNHNVKVLVVDLYGGAKFPKWGMLPLLRDLTLNTCKVMESLPQGGMLSSLQCLSIIRCSKLIASGRDCGLHELLSLKQLQIHYIEDMECFPEEGLLPPNLQSLSFFKCTNLKRINHRSLIRLHSFTSLSFEYCPRMSFEGMPEDGLPPFLSHLTIDYRCPLLMERCEKEKGPDWLKIAHIPHICMVW